MPLVATAVAVANMTAMRDEGLMGHVLDNEAYFTDQLRAMGDAHPCIREVRGWFIITKGRSPLRARERSSS